MPEVAGNTGVYSDPNSVDEIADGIFSLAQKNDLFVLKSRNAQQGKIFFERKFY